MKIIEVQDQVAGAQVAFEILQDKLAKGAKVLGLATGSTPLAFYKRLVESDLDFSALTSVNLDEYVGLSADNPQSYRYFMDKHLFYAKPFKASFVPDGQAEDLQAAVKAYDEILAAHPVDLQVLGIGQNGHIGFNEPGTSFEAHTQVVDLALSTIAANARFFENEAEVPRQAISMGIASIMASKSIILMAYGTEKAAAIHAMLTGEVTPQLPASILQKHEDVILIADQAALSLYHASL